MEKDMKFDEGKLRYDLVAPEFIEGVARVMTYGAEKYAPDSWKTVKGGKNRYYAALMRHLEAIRRGEFVDGESGLPHIDHVACNVMFLKFFYENGEEGKKFITNLINGKTMEAFDFLGVLETNPYNFKKGDIIYAAGSRKYILSSYDKDKKEYILESLYVSGDGDDICKANHLKEFAKV